MDQLRISTGPTDSGLANRSIVVVFRNATAQSCRLYGYPGVAALNRKGAQLAQAERTPNGYLGGLPNGSTPPIVDLAPGQSASAMVEAAAPTCSVSQDPTCADRWYTGLLLTPPNDTRSVTLTWPGGDAGQGLQVHPVVPGETGSA